MVSTEVTRVSNCKQGLKITVPAEDIAVIRASQLKIVQKEADIQGFRRGRAPIHLVQKYYQGTIERYTLDEALQHGYQEGLKKSEIVPIAEPVITKFDFDEQKNLIMEVEVDTYPEVELKKYTGIKIEKEVFKITDEDVQDSLDYLRKQKAEISTLDGKAENGHFVTVTMQEVDEGGIPIVGKKYEDIRFEIGDGKFDRDIEIQLIGLQAGEEKLIEKKYDGKDAPKNLAGKVERFRVKLEKIETEVLPEMTDEFVKELKYEEIETLDKLKERIRTNLEAQWGQESEQRFYHKFVHELLENNPFEVPDSVVERYLDQIVDDIKKRDKKVNTEKVRKNYHAEAEFNIKWFYLKEKIAEIEKVKAEEVDFEKYLEDIKEDNLKKIYAESKDLKKRIMNDIYEKKIFDYLVDHSKISVKEKSIRKEMGSL